MPVIIFDGPVMTKEQKEQLIKEFATAASRVLNIPEKSFITIIKETEPENVGIGTESLANIKKK